MENDNEGNGIHFRKFDDSRSVNSRCGAQNWCAGGANTQGRKINTTERPVAAFAMTKATY